MDSRAKAPVPWAPPSPPRCRWSGNGAPFFDPAERNPEGWRAAHCSRAIECEVGSWCTIATNIDLDDRASDTVRRRHSLATKRRAANFALRKVATEALDLDAARRLPGSGWEGDLQQLRHGRGECSSRRARCALAEALHLRANHASCPIRQPDGGNDTGRGRRPTLPRPALGVIMTCRCLVPGGRRPWWPEACSSWAAGGSQPSTTARCQAPSWPARLARWSRWARPAQTGRCRLPS